jgi:FHA domain
MYTGSMLACCVECWRGSPLHVIEIPYWLDRPIAIGRMVGHLVMFNHQTVARTMALLRWRSADELWITNTNSTNGTRLNGQPIDSIQIVDGLELSFGVPRLVFFCGEGAKARAHYFIKSMDSTDPVTRLPMASGAAFKFEMPHYDTLVSQHGEMAAERLEQLIGATLQVMFAGHPQLTWLSPGAFGLPAAVDVGQHVRLTEQIANTPPFQ